MKPLSIADYLDRLGSAAEEKAPPRPRGLAVSPPKPAEPAEWQAWFRSRSSIAWRTRRPSGKRDGEDGFSAHAMGAKAGSARPRRRGNRRRQESRSSPRTCRRNSPTLTPAAASKASRKAASRLRTATRPSSPLRGSRRKRSSRSFVSTNMRNSKARSGPGSEQIEDNVGAAVTRILAPFLSQQVVKRAVDELATRHRSALRWRLARIDQDLRTRARARAPARANRRSADQGRICRERRGGNRRRGQRHADRRRASPVGRVAGFVRGLSGADDRGASGNHHRQAP